LMEVLYTTAVQTMKWNEGSGRASERHPAALFDVPTNLDVGVGYDALQTRLAAFRGQSSADFTCLDDYRAALMLGLGAYNDGSWRHPNLAYGQAVVGGAVDYKVF
jgi:hypothetical protein